MTTDKTKCITCGKSRPNPLVSKCRDCLNKYQREYRKTPKQREYQREYRKTPKQHEYQREYYLRKKAERAGK